MVISVVVEAVGRWAAGDQFGSDLAVKRIAPIKHRVEEEGEEV